MYFTANPGSQAPAPVAVPGGQVVVVPVHHGFQGNFYAVKAGAPNKPGMLGEVAFDAWENNNFYDVSAIVDPTDVDNVSQMWGANDSAGPFTAPTNAQLYSGCADFHHLCKTVYINPDDVQTKSTTDPNIIATLGNNGVTFVASSGASDSPAAKRRYVEDVEGLPHDYVLGKH